MIFSADEWRGSQPCFLLTVEFAGVVYRFSSFPISISSVDGDLQFEGGLEDFELEESTGFLGVDTQANSLSTSVVFDGLDLLEMWRKGFSLEGVPGELGYVLVKDGALLHSWEDRIVLIKGMIQAPVFSDPQEPVGFCAFSLEQMPWDSMQSDSVLEPLTKITDLNFPKHDEESAGGKFPPVVIGGGITVITALPQDINIASTPAYCIQKHTPAGDHALFLIAAHPVRASSVIVIDPFGNESASRSVETGVDALGNVYSYVDLDAETYPFSYPGRTLLTGEQPPGDPQWWVKWPKVDVPASGTLSGCYLNPLGEGAMEGGGDICLWAMLQGGYEVDESAWTGLIPILNNYKFHGYINDPDLKYWDFLTEMIIPNLPIEVKNGPNGIRPILAIMYAPHSAFQAYDIRLGSDFFQSGPITVETLTSDIVNQITMNFALEGPNDNHVCALTMGAGLDTGITAENSPVCEISQARYGVQVDNIESDWIYDRYTAFMVARFMARSQSLPMISIEFTADPIYGWIQVGDLLKITGDTVWTGQFFTVSSKVWEGTGWIFVLLLESNPNLQSRYFSGV